MKQILASYSAAYDLNFVALRYFNAAGAIADYDVDQRRPGEASTLVACSDNVQNLLGWKPTRPAMEDIVASVCDWQGKHPNGYT